MKFGTLGRITADDITNNPQRVADLLNELLKRTELVFNGNIDFINNVKCDIKTIPLRFEVNTLIMSSDDIYGVLALNVINTSANSLENNEMRDFTFNWKKVVSGITIFPSWWNITGHETSAEATFLILKK